MRSVNSNDDNGDKSLGDARHNTEEECNAPHDARDTEFMHIHGYGHHGKRAARTRFTRSVIARQGPQA